MKKFYITSPIYYSSGKPHIGHAYTTTLADVYSKYKKMIGYNTFFLTGMDEHGQKIEEIAKKENISPQKLVDKNSKIFLDLWNKLGINFDSFVRTTDQNHIECVQKVFSRFINNDYVYLDNWKGLYCISCEENYSYSSSIEKEGRLYCKLGHELIEKNEQSYFLKIKEFSEWLKDLFLENKNFIFPSSRTKELINNFIDSKDGLSDLSVTRTSFDWGIHVIENHRHVIYVWLDALLSYISGLGYLSNNSENFEKYWNDPNTEIIHLMSKEITRFHCIYWPSILKMLNLRLPSKIISHGWIVTKEGKMSKSLGNVIDPMDYINKYGRDSLRYFFIKEIPLDSDGIFSQDLFVSTFNSDLANNFGNLVSRTIGMLNKYQNGKILPSNKNSYKNEDKLFEKEITNLIDNCRELIEKLEIKELLKMICGLQESANKYIEVSKPWEKIKNNKNDEVANMLFLLSNAIKTINILLSPILIDGSKLVFNQMNFDNKLFSFEALKSFDNVVNVTVKNSVPIYTRIEK